MQFFEIIMYIIIICAVLWLSYVLSRKIAGHAGGFNTSKYMTHVDRLPLNREAQLSIVRIGDKYVLLGVSGDKVEMLKDLEESELKELEPSLAVPSKTAEYVKSLLDTAFEKAKHIAVKIKELAIRKKFEFSEKVKQYQLKKQNTPKGEKTKNKKSPKAEKSQNKDKSQKKSKKSEKPQKREKENTALSFAQLLNKGTEQKDAPREKSPKTNDKRFDEILQKAAQRTDELRRKTDKGEGTDNE